MKIKTHAKQRLQIFWISCGVIIGCSLSFLSYLFYYSIFSQTGLMFLNSQFHGHAADESLMESSLFSRGDVKEVPATLPMVENELVQLLTKTVRVMCLVLTTSKYHRDRAIHVKNTWGRRCNRLVFISDEDDPTLGAVSMSTNSGYFEVWGKVRTGFKWAHDSYLNDFDWFIKADDDSYVIMENLRLLLSHYDPDEGLYLGRLFKPYVKQGYMSGGAGYVLSRKALSLLVTEGFRQPKYCSIWSDSGTEDVEMGRCLSGAGVRAVDTRDSFGRQRFMPFRAIEHLQIGRVPKSFWIWSYDYHGYVEGPECCSNVAVTFHYVGPNDMYVLEYLLYRLRPFGVHWKSKDADTREELNMSPVALISELRKSHYKLPSDLTDKVMQDVLFSNSAVSISPISISIEKENS